MKENDAYWQSFIDISSRKKHSKITDDILDILPFLARIINKRLQRTNIC
jgi:hypothetical protein